MKWQVVDTPGTSGIDAVSVGLREQYDVDDGVFETPDDLDAATIERLENAGHTRLEDTSSDAEAGGNTPEDGEDAPENEEDDGVDDEYADMSREALYEEYKDREGPESWNDCDADFLRRSLRTHDEHGTFPTIEEE